MIIKNEEDILSLIAADEWMMEILKIVKALDLPDCWICAGFVRSKIWDVLHGFTERTPLPDVDVVFYDSIHINEAVEKELEKRLKMLKPGIPWSVKNQARMHQINNLPPYTSSIDAVSKFPETCTALAVKLDQDDNVVLAAPWGIQDAINIEVRPTPFFIETEDRMHIYEERIRKKNWPSIWEKVKVNPGMVKKDIKRPTC